MSRPRYVPDGELEEQELEHADEAHELPDRGQAAGLRSQLPMHSRQGRKDRRELTRHAARILVGRSEEEFVAPVTIANAGEQCFDAVHGAKLRAGTGGSE